MAGDIRLSKEERQWTRDTLKNKLGNRASTKNIRKLGLSAEYKKKFKRKISDAGLYSRFHSLLQEMGIKTPKKSRKMEKVFETSAYIVYLKDGGVFGYDNLDEVKNFVVNSGIIGNIHVFKKAEINIKYNIEIK